MLIQYHYWEDLEKLVEQHNNYVLRTLQSGHKIRYYLTT